MESQNPRVFAEPQVFASVCGSRYSRKQSALPDRAEREGATSRALYPGRVAGVPAEHLFGGKAPRPKNSQSQIFPILLRTKFFTKTLDRENIYML
jgi:hypothetical protein